MAKQGLSEDRFDAMVNELDLTGRDPIGFVTNASFLDTGIGIMSSPSRPGKTGARKRRLTRLSERTRVPSSTDCDLRDAEGVKPSGQRRPPAFPTGAASVRGLVQLKAKPARPTGAALDWQRIVQKSWLIGWNKSLDTSACFHCNRRLAN